jgi:hypothetical protein
MEGEYIMFQQVNTKARSSKDYLGSIYAADAAGMLQLEDLRRMVKNLNTDLRKFGAIDTKGNPIQFRVRVCGREPIETGTATHWLFGTAKDRKYDWGGNCIGGLANASRFDIYLYRR